MQNYYPEPITYSVKDACRLSSIGKTRMYSLMAEGQVKSRLVGKRRLVDAASLRNLLAG